MGTQASGAAEGQDNVYPLHVETGEVIDPAITAKILNLETIGSLRDYTDIAKQAILSAIPGTTSAAAVNDRLKADASHQLSDDHQFALAELQLLMSKHGKTPPASVEGIIQLRGMMVDMYRDNQLQPKQVRLELAKLEREIQALELTDSEFRTKTWQWAKAEATRAEEEAVAALRSLEQQKKEFDADQIRGELGIKEAEAEVAENSVIFKTRVGKAKNADSVIGKELLADLLAKRIRAVNAVIGTVVSGVVHPVLGKVFKVAIFLIVAAIVYSFIMEQAEMSGYPLLDAADNIRHLLLDPIYRAITNNLDKVGK